MKSINIEKVMIVLAIVLALYMLLVVPANAQTEPVRTATLTWTAPAACADGSPITNCPVTGYIVEKQNGSTWSPIGTTAEGVRRFEQTNLALGTHTYRVLANSAAGPSAPSSSASKTIAVPGAPGSIVVTITVTVSTP